MYLPAYLDAMSRWLFVVAFVVVASTAQSFAKFYDPRAKLEQRFFAATDEKIRKTRPFTYQPDETIDDM